MEKNKVRFGLNKVHYAKIVNYNSDGTPNYGNPVRLPGAVSLSLDVVGEASNFYADNGIYYVLNNNSGYEGDLEVALITKEFAVDILGETLDSSGTLLETNNAQLSEFALLFEFDGDKNHIRHCLYKCTATRSGLEGSTTEEDKEVQTETLSLTAGALDNGLIKRKTTESTPLSEYNTWYERVVLPTISASTDTSNIDLTITHTPATTTFTDSVSVMLDSAIYDQTSSSSSPNGYIVYRKNFSGEFITYARNTPIELTETTTIEAYVRRVGVSGTFDTNGMVVTYTKLATGE